MSSNYSSKFISQPIADEIKAEVVVFCYWSITKTSNWTKRFHCFTFQLVVKNERALNPRSKKHKASPKPNAAKLCKATGSARRLLRVPVQESSRWRYLNGWVAREAALLDMLRSFVCWVSWPHFGQGGSFPFSCLKTLLRTWSSQKQACGVKD